MKPTNNTHTPAPIELQLFSGATVTYADEGALIAAGVELVEGQSIFNPDDCGVLRALWPIMKGRMPASPGEIRLHEISRNFFSVDPPKPPPPPTPVDDQVEEVRAELTALQAKKEETEAEVYERVDAYDVLSGAGSLILRGRAGPVTFVTGRGARPIGIPTSRYGGGDEQGAIANRAQLLIRAEAEAQEALERHERAKDDWKRVRVKLTELEQQQARLRRARRASD